MHQFIHTCTSSYTHTPVHTHMHHFIHTCTTSYIHLHSGIFSSSFILSLIYSLSPCPPPHQMRGSWWAKVTSLPGCSDGTNRTTSKLSAGKRPQHAVAPWASPARGQRALDLANHCPPKRYMSFLYTNKSALFNFRIRR